MFLTALLVLGTKESARFNVIITVAHLVLVVFIIIAGATGIYMTLYNIQHTHCCISGQLYRHAMPYRCLLFPCNSG